VKVDTGDLINATEVARLVGLSNSTSIPTYRARYPDFPSPVVMQPPCFLWRRQDVIAWAKATGRRPRPSAD
jgi:predicted DNA-binding transcriptional regulator AlpA